MMTQEHSYLEVLHRREYNDALIRQHLTALAFISSERTDPYETDDDGEPHIDRGYDRIDVLQPAA